MTSPASFSWRRMAAGPWDASHILALAALLVPCVGLWAPMGLSPLFVLTALALLVLGWRDRVWRSFPASLALHIALICGWAGLSAIWAVDPARSLFSAVQLALNAVGGMLLVGTARRIGPQGATRVGLAMVAGIAFGLVAFGFGLVSFRRLHVLLQSLHSDEFGAYRVAIQVFNRGATVTALMAVPALAVLWLWHGRAKAWGLGVPVVAMMVTAKALSLKLLLGIGVLTLVFFRRPSRSMGLALGLLLAGLTVAVPLGAVRLPPPQATAEWSWLPYSSHHRLTIWDFSAQRIMERPILGWGMDSARSMPGGEDVVTILMEIPRGSGRRVEVPEQKLPLHPHNAVLQWWLELGAVGAALFAVLLLRLGRAALGREAPAARTICAGTLLVGCVAVSLVSFGFWQSWWQCFMWFLAAWFCALEPLWSPGISRDGAAGTPSRPEPPPG